MQFTDLTWICCRARNRRMTRLKIIYRNTHPFFFNFTYSVQYHDASELKLEIQTRGKTRKTLLPASKCFANEIMHPMSGCFVLSPSLQNARHFLETAREFFIFFFQKMPFFTFLFGAGHKMFWWKWFTLPLTKAEKIGTSEIKRRVFGQEGNEDEFSPIFDK